MTWDELFGQTRRTFLKAAIPVGVLSSTSRTTAQAQINAEIADIEVSADRVTYDDTVPADITLRNTGATEADFYVDYNVVAPGEDDPFPRRVDGEDGAEATLAPGDEATVTVEWEVDDDASTGSYDIYVAVYDQSAQSDITVPLDEATIRNAFELRESGSEIDATINEFDTDGGNVVVGETVESTVTVENTGDVENTFYVGYSMYAHADGEAYSEGTSGTSVTLEPGEQETVTVSWTAPEDAPTGPYDAVTAVWEESSIDELDTQLDRAENEAAISVEGTEVQPTAAFDISTEDPIVGEEVEFDASGSEAPDGTIEAYRWDFTGDGDVDATGETVTHTFDEPGEYEVTLTIVDDTGNEASTQQTVTVEEEPVTRPTADFDVITEDPIVGEEVEFDASDSEAPDGTIEEYRWDMTGDSEVDTTGEVITYEFDESGEYEVTLTVVDNEDNEDSGQEVVRVDPAPLEPELRSSMLDFESVLVPHGHIRIDFILENMDTNDISEPSINLDIPDGWQISDRDDRDGTWVDSDTRWEYDDLPPDEAAQAEVEVGVPADSEEGEYTISATATSQTETLDTTSVTVSIVDRFHPRIHAYGFWNWSGDEFETVDGEELNHAHNYPSLTEIRQVIRDTWPESLVKGNLLTPHIATIIYVWLNQQTATNGHCYGMAFTAKDYYRNPEDLPSEIDIASQIPKVTDEFESIGDQIDYVQNTQNLEFNVFLTKVYLMTADNIDYETELGAIIDAIDDRGAAGIGLSKNTGSQHAVLAYHYTETETEIALTVYDPVFSANQYDADDLEYGKSIQFNRTGSEPAMEPYRGYDRLIHLDADREIDSVGLGAGLLYIAVKSPVRIEVDGPEGTSPFRLEADYADYDATQYGDFVTVIGPNAGDYDITVYGEADGEYTLEVFGTTEDGKLIDEEVTRQIQDGETHAFRAEVPETSADEGHLQEVETTDPDDDDSPEWLPYAGAGAGAAGIGALLYQYLKGDDSPTGTSDASRHKQGSETTSDNE